MAVAAPPTKHEDTDDVQRTKNCTNYSDKLQHLSMILISALNYTSSCSQNAVKLRSAEGFPSCSPYSTSGEYNHIYHLTHTYAPQLCTDTVCAC